MDEHAPDTDLLTVRETAKLLQVAESTVYKNQTRLGARKIFGKVCIPRSNAIAVLKGRPQDIDQP